MRISANDRSRINLKTLTEEVRLAFSFRWWNSSPDMQGFSGLAMGDELSIIWTDDGERAYYKTLTPEEEVQLRRVIESHSSLRG